MIAPADIGKPTWVVHGTVIGGRGRVVGVQTSPSTVSGFDVGSGHKEWTVKVTHSNNQQPPAQAGSSFTDGATVWSLEAGKKIATLDKAAFVKRFPAAIAAGGSKAVAAYESLLTFGSGSIVAEVAATPPTSSATSISGYLTQDGALIRPASRRDSMSGIPTKYSPQSGSVNTSLVSTNVQVVSWTPVATGKPDAQYSMLTKTNGKAVGAKPLACGSTGGSDDSSGTAASADGRWAAVGNVLVDTKTNTMTCLGGSTGDGLKPLDVTPDGGVYAQRGPGDTPVFFAAGSTTAKELPANTVLPTSLQGGSVLYNTSTSAVVGFKAQG